MTIKEFRNSVEYEQLMERIRCYRRGFTFTIVYGEIPSRKAAALKILLKDCVDKGLLDVVSHGLDIHGDLVEIEYRRM